MYATMQWMPTLANVVGWWWWWWYMANEVVDEGSTALGGWHASAEQMKSGR